MYFNIYCDFQCEPKTNLVNLAAILLFRDEDDNIIVGIRKSSQLKV